MLLATAPLQLGLGIEQIHLTRSARLEEQNHRLGRRIGMPQPRSQIRPAGDEWVTTAGGQQPVGCEQMGQGQSAETKGRGLEEVASGEGGAWRARICVWLIHDRLREIQRKAGVASSR